MEEGAAFEYTMYNKKGKTEGVSSYKVTSVENDGDGTTATMAISFTDEKGKNVYDTDYSFTCTGDKVIIDFESLMPTQMIEQYAEMDIDMDISGTDIELPNNLSVGQALEDANFSMKISMGGINMTTTVDMINRKVEKKEMVTTTAGSFDCYVIYSENEAKVMMTTQSVPSRVWLAEGVGMVKQESYNKKGDLTHSTQLTQLTR